MKTFKLLALTVLGVLSQATAHAESPSATATKLIEANIPKQFAADGCTVRFHKRGEGFTLEVSDENAETIRAATSTNVTFKEISKNKDLIRIGFTEDVKSIQGKTLTTLIEMTPKATRISLQFDNEAPKSKTCNY